MSIEFFEEINFDDFDPTEGATCKRCGVSGLDWEHGPHGKWRLVEADYTPHVCTAFNETVNDFEVLK